MTPVTKTAPIVDIVPIGSGRTETTQTVRQTSPRSPPPAQGKSSSAVSSTIRHISAFSSSTLRKQVTTRSLSLTSSTSVPRETSTTTSTTTQKEPFISRQSPGGGHQQPSTLFPPVSQGQHLTTTAGGGGENTVAIVTGVIVPLILIGAGALLFYIWYRRKYPVRMVLGRDFNRFSNPAYNTRASTITLVRQDAEKEWERLDTLSRKNPELSLVKEDGPEGVDNRAFEMEEEITYENIKLTVGKKTETSDGNVDERKDSFELLQETEEIIPNNTEGPVNVGISRERPKTKRAVLVKTDTVEDLENGFGLVTESDLGVRTESEVSSGNESTETHTISLSFSDTFDSRHKDEETSSGDKKNDDNDTGRKKGQNSNTENEKDINSQEESAIDDGNESVPSDQLKQNETQKEAISPERKSDNDTPSTTQNTFKDESLETSETVCTQDSMLEARSSEPASVETVNQFSEIKSSKPYKSIDNDNEENIGEEHQYVLNEAAVDVPDKNTDEFDENNHTDTSPVTLKDKNEAGENDVQYDNIFETMSESEDVVMKNNQPVQDTTEKVTPDNEKIMQQENVNGQQKGNVTESDFQKSLPESSSTGFDSEQSLPATDNNSDSTSAETDTGTKNFSLNMSNENIVLDTNPPTPTVFIQESFILENEPTLPVYLDSTNMSPVRGRRAFTLNDIESEQSFGDSGGIHGFSLPKGMGEISKSTPVICGINSSEISESENKKLNYATFDTKGKEKGKISSKEDLGENFSENESYNMHDIGAETNEGDEELIYCMQDARVTFKVPTEQNTEQLNLDVYKTESKANEVEYDSNNPVEIHSESTEKNNYFENDTFDFDHENTNTSTNDSLKDNSLVQFNDITPSTFSFISDSYTQNLTQDTACIHSAETDQSNEGFLEDEGTEFFTTGMKQDEDMDIDVSSKNQHGFENVALEKSFDDNSPALTDFTQSFTPKFSAIDTHAANPRENLERKKVLPHNFNFQVSNNSDDDTSKTDSSSESESEANEPSEMVHSKHFKAYDTFETKVLSFEKPNTDTKVDVHKDTSKNESISVNDDEFDITKSTDLVTTLSYGNVSKGNSNDLSNMQNFGTEYNGESFSELLHTSNSQHVETTEALTLPAESSSPFNFLSDIPEQSASDKANEGSSGMANISLGVFDEEEC